MTYGNASGAVGSGAPVLFSKQVYETDKARIEGERKERQEYFDSLPSDPAEALAKINGLLRDFDHLGGPEYAPRAALEILHALASSNALDEGRDFSHALYWLLSEGLAGMKLIDQRTQAIWDIAAKVTSKCEPYQA